MRSLSERNKHRLFSKLKPYREYTECVGFLLPTEILYLMDIGCKIYHFASSWKIEEAQRRVKVGEMYATWFYFKPTKELLAEMRERFPEFCKHGRPPSAVFRSFIC